MPATSADAGPPLVHVGRQPIYDRSGDVVAYELFFRDSTAAVSAGGRGPQATGRVIVSAFTEFGLAHLAGAKACFINVTREFLVGELPVPFDAGQAVLEVIETVDVDDSVVAGVANLVERGFAIALDDFVWDGPAQPLLDSATYVKIDMLGADPDEVRDTVQRCRRHRPMQLIAERLETEEQLRHAFELGFDLFQGHALGRPHLVSRVGLSAGRISRLQLVTALGDPDIDVNRVVELIMQDPAISYRLLHATNSAASGLTARVSSVRDAAVLLGLETVRKWVVLMLFSDLTDATEQQLTATMTRARFCQLIAQEHGLSGDAAFTVGLLSSIAELISQPSDALIAELPLTPDVESALTAGAGRLGEVLRAVRSYEYGDVDEATRLLGVGPSGRAGSMVNTYLAAIGWSTRLLDALPVEEASRRAMPRA